MPNSIKTVVRLMADKYARHPSRERERQQRAREGSEATTAHTRKHRRYSNIESSDHKYKVQASTRSFMVYRAIKSVSCSISWYMASKY